MLGAALAAPAAFAWPAFAARPAARVASLDLLLTELLLTLDLQPLAVANIPLYRRLVAEPEIAETVVDLGPLQDPNPEYLLALAPDLLLVAEWQAARLSALKRIAPVEALPTFPGKTPALENVVALARRLGALTGRESVAEARIREMEAAFAAAADLAALGPPPLYVCRFAIDGRHMAVFGGNGMIGQALDRLSLRNAWTGRVNAAGVISAPIRKLAETPEAAILHFDRGAETEQAMAALEQSPLWRALPAVREGRVIRMPVVYPNGGLRSAMRFAELLKEGLMRLRAGEAGGVDGQIRLR